jgi:hypothetical protein
MHAPDRPVPLPRAVTGTPDSAAMRTTAATSPADDGRTTTSGKCHSADNASSWA